MFSWGGGTVCNRYPYRTVLSIREMLMMQHLMLMIQSCVSFLPGQLRQKRVHYSESRDRNPIQKVILFRSIPFLRHLFSIHVRRGGVEPPGPGGSGFTNRSRSLRDYRRICIVFNCQFTPAGAYGIEPYTNRFGDDSASLAWTPILRAIGEEGT